MIDLDKLVTPKPTSIKTIDVGALIAPVNVKPSDWHTCKQLPPNASGGSKPPVLDSADLRRIAALPYRPRPDANQLAAMVALMGSRLAKPPTLHCKCRSHFKRDCITTLLPTQAWALYEIGLAEGLLGPIGVGHGKTILNLLTPMVMPRCELALLLLPPNLVDQLIKDYQLIAQHFRVPSLVVHGKNWNAIQPGAPVLHVFPYSRLSRPEATVFLESLLPDTIIADECDKLKHRRTATTGRVLRHFGAHPETRFCGWTGSMTDASIKDYAHLAAMALRYGSPLPLDPIVVDDWARAIDPADYQAPAGALFKLCEKGEHVYDGYQRRFTQTLGVVSTTTSAIDAALVIEERQAPPIPAVISDMMSDVRDNWQRPDGDELVDQLAVARCLRELACGFYYRWKFPRGESREQIDLWLEIRKKWNKELRSKLWVPEPHLDSPMLCKLAAKRYHGDVENPDPNLPVWESQHWPSWRDIKDTVKPETEAIRVDDYLARDAAQWAHDNLGVVWYDSGAFGLWVAELSGLPLHGGGPKAGELIDAEQGDRSIIASIHSHGTGRNGLQFLYKTQLVAQPPASSKKWEQLLGRLHRIGQDSDEVHALFYRHTDELKRHVDTALSRALYVQGTIGAAQKLRAGFDFSE